MQQLHDLIYKTDRNGKLVDALPVHIDRWMDEDTGEWQMEKKDTMNMSKMVIRESESLRNDIEKAQRRHATRPARSCERIVRLQVDFLCARKSLFLSQHCSVVPQQAKASLFHLCWALPQATQS